MTQDEIPTVPNTKTAHDELLREQEEAVNKELEALAQGDGSTETPNETPAPKTDDGQSEEVAPETKPDDANTEDDAHSQLSERGQKRVQQLANDANKVPELEEEIARLKKLVDKDLDPLVPDWLKPTEPKKVEPTSTRLPWDTTKDDGDGSREISQEELEADITKRATEVAREEIRREKLVERLNTDIVTVETRYQELRKPTDDKPNPGFDQDLVDFITNTYQKLVKQDTSMRLLDFVDTVMSLKKKGAESAKKQTQQVIKKMAAEQAVDASGATPIVEDDGQVEAKIKGAKNMKELEALEKSISGT